MTLKKDDNEVAVSSILVRNDRLNDKGMKVNEFLQVRTEQFKLGFIEHNNIEKCHLNYGGLHLTPDGDTLLEDNFVKFINL